MRKLIWSSLFVLMMPELVFGAVSITLNSPSSGANFDVGSHISATGSSSFGSTDNSVDLIEIYVVADNPNPSLGVITDSELVNIYSRIDYMGGGGERSFNTDGVAFNAYKKSNGNSTTPYYVSVRPMNAAAGFYETIPGSGAFLYVDQSIIIN